MSKLDDIEALTKEVTASSITILPKRCSYIRNWNSSCKACMNACHHDAISRKIGRIKIDAEKCTGCGACAAACPMSAMLTSAPNQTDIVRAAKATAANYGGIAAFACRRHADELGIDETRVTILPCLNYLDEYLICGLLAIGINRVALLCPGCEDCSVDSSEPYFPAVVKSARNLMKTWGTTGKVKIFKDVPDDICHTKGAHIAKSSRRDALTQAGGSAMSYVMNSIDEAVTGQKKHEPDPDRQVVVKPEDVFPPDTYRGPRIKKMLDRVGQLPEGASIESRFWATVDIDGTKCIRCGCCAMMCATHALVYVQDLPENPTRTQRKEAPGTLAFMPDMCMACGLCADSCFRKAMVIGNRIPASYLDPDMLVLLFENEKQKNPRKYGI